MPLYPYVCNSCKHEWTELRSAKEPMPCCEKCTSHDVTRTIGNTTFRTPGKGWASTGYSKV